MLKAVFFDLDGTLLPMDENEFTNVYFHKLYEKVKDIGYNKDELIKTVWDGTKMMYKNDGSITNEEAFWDYFVKVYGSEKLKDKDIFDNFYLNEFKTTKNVCKDNPIAKDIVKYAKDKTGIVVLSTNPIFPYNGTITRMSFVGLKEEDFDFITAYENSNFTKPNPNYFKTLLDKFNLKGEEVILFGNNDIEDYMCAKMCGIDCYLVGDNLIIDKDKNINAPKIKMDEVIRVIDEEYNKRGIN